MYTSRMRCIVGRAWASSAWYDWEKSNSKQWHEGEKSNNLAFELMTCVTRRRWRMCTWRVFALIWSPVPQQLASFPGPKTGWGYSAVVFDRFQARPALRRFSIPECWARGWERGYISLARLPQQLLEQHALLSLMSWAYSACAAVFVLLFQQRAGSGVTFDSTFLFEARPLFAWVTSRTRLCHVNDRPPKLRFENFNIDYLLVGLDLLQEHGCEKFKCIFKFFTTWLSLFNKYEIYGTTYEYIHTYIHTDTARVQHINVGNTKFTVRRTNTYIHTYIHTYIQTPLAFNTLMWGSLRLAPIKKCTEFSLEIVSTVRVAIGS